MHRLSAMGARAVVALLLCLQAAATSAAIWWDVAPSPKALTGESTTPIYYRALSADEDALKQVLAQAPQEYTTSQGAEIRLPMPDGSMQRFEVENSPIMAPELAARYPQIQTYRVKGIDDPTATGRLDMTPKGFHGMITNSSDTVYIEPGGFTAYRSFTRQAYAVANKALVDEQTDPYCLLDEELVTAARAAEDIALRIEGQRRVYRLAVAATGEYTIYHGGTVSQALSAIVTAINRVNQIYGRDVAVQFVLVSNNDLIIYTDPESDPYTNDNGFLMLDENQTTIKGKIGSANYDIGHVFSTLGGGIAAVGSTCNDDQKAKGVTGRPNPIDDIFYIDLVAHEIGHQLSATHSFNGTTDNCGGTNRTASTAVEPGSGSTIMAYAGMGMCGAENLQNFTDATFHAISIQQIVAFIKSGNGARCGALFATENTAPNVNAGIDYTVPVDTPFRLMGSATDAEGDILSFQWDEMDAGGDDYATNASTFGTDLGGNPLFRSFSPKDAPLRTFPRLGSFLEVVADPAEVLPTTSRTLNFRLTVRDGESGIAEDDVKINVDISQGPFDIIDGSLSGGGDFLGGSTQSIGWSMNTACQQMDISLLSFSRDGTTYCDASDDPDLDLGTFLNDKGTATVTLPQKTVSRGRVSIACSENIFFALTSVDMSVNSATDVAADDCKGVDGTVVAHGTVFNDAGIAITIDQPSDDGGGGALLILPILLGLGAAGRIWDRRVRT